MKRTISFVSLICLAGAFVFLAGSCNKELSNASTTTSTTSTNTSSTSPTIAVALDSASSGADSIYILQTCAHGYFRDSVSASALPASVSSYLSSNYSGYTLRKAFEIKDSAGTIGGYVTIIIYNGKPVALLFDASGNFEKVLEQRQSCDLDNDGWHAGGRFCNRDGHQRDTVALSSLPASILTYMSTNYPQDTLIRAYINIDSSYLVISQDNGIFATLFDSAGNFIKRVQIPSPGGHKDHTIQLVAQTDLPASALTYLSTTYPNYVFDKAFSYTLNGVLQGYLVVIDANSTKYAVQFDASGNFIGAITIW